MSRARTPLVKAFHYWFDELVLMGKSAGSAEPVPAQAGIRNLRRIKAYRTTAPIRRSSGSLSLGRGLG